MASFLHVLGPLAASALIAVARLPAIAQSPKPPLKHKTVYTRVEHMPQLLGDERPEAIVKAIQQQLVYPPEALSAYVQGKVYASFIVAATGRIERIVILKGILPACDSAVVKAVQRLPRFVPGRQAGRAVAVLYTVPVTFTIQESQK